MKREIAVFLICVMSCLTSAAVLPPTEAQIAEHGVTFEQLAQIQLERDHLFPSHLRRIGSLPELTLEQEASCSRGLSSLWDSLSEFGNRTKSAVACYGKAIWRFYVPAGLSNEDIDLLSDLLKQVPNSSYQENFRALKHNLKCFISASEAAEKNPLLRKDFSTLSDYSKPRTSNMEFFNRWFQDLGLLVGLHAKIQAEFDELLSVIRSFGTEISPEQIARLSRFKQELLEKGNNLNIYLDETAKYLEFENACSALHQKFLGKDAVKDVLTEQLQKNTGLNDIVEDFVRFGFLYGKNDIHADFNRVVRSYSIEGLLDSLSVINRATRSSVDVDVLKKLDAVYRIVFLAIQETGLVNDYRALIIERQLAMNGVDLAFAYREMLSSIYKGASQAHVGAASWDNLSSGLQGLKRFFENNPLEAEILAADLAHAYSILTRSSSDVIGQIRDMGANILSRRNAMDFVRDVLFGKYDPVYEVSLLSPEMIAFCHLSASMKYVLGGMKGVLEQNLGSSLAMVSASAVGMATGTAIPAVLVALGKGLFGALQTHVEWKGSNYLPSNTEVSALLNGLLTTFDTGSVHSGFMKAAGLYGARKIASTIGTNWCDYRENRLRNIALRAAAFLPVAAISLTMGLSYYSGIPVDWVSNRELVHGLACASVYCASRIENPTKAERIAKRRAEIIEEIDLSLTKEIAPLSTCMNCEPVLIEQASRNVLVKAINETEISDENDKQLFLDKFNQSLLVKENREITKNMSVRDFCEKVFGKEGINKVVSPLGILQLQMIYQMADVTQINK